ncbi:DUF4085 domain-containing protein [Pendulispora rubella]|uniref:DUF4085 domain-containing protein n=1 Tax=Pendulispora rubella TaxID=2741070 RepID=A0ABZ2L6E4_9BACT
MRYFTRGWANGELTDDAHALVCDAYAARLEQIVFRFPSSMARLHQETSLHDALIESVRWKPSAAELQLRLVAGTSEIGYQTVSLTYRGAMLGRPRIASLRNAANDREACVLYQELDIADDGTFAHRLLFWPNEEVTIEFRELEYDSAPRNDCRVTLGGAFVVEGEEEPA